jgi:hypothetical protein
MAVMPQVSGTRPGAQILIVHGYSSGTMTGLHADTEILILYGDGCFAASD